MVKISIIFDAHKKYSASFKIVEKVDDIKSAQFYKCDIRSLNPDKSVLYFFDLRVSAILHF